VLAAAIIINLLYKGRTISFSNHYYTIISFNHNAGLKWKA